MGNSLASLAIRLGMSPAGIGYAVQRGEPLLIRMVISLFNEIFTYLRMSPITHFFSLFHHSPDSHHFPSKHRRPYHILFYIIPKSRGRNREMAGTYVIINNITSKINNVGTTALQTEIKFSPVNAITIYRFTPTGGV